MPHRKKGNTLLYRRVCAHRNICRLLWWTWVCVCECWSWQLFDLCTKVEVFKRWCSIKSGVRAPGYLQCTVLPTPKHKQTQKSNKDFFFFFNWLQWSFRYSWRQVFTRVQTAHSQTAEILTACCQRSGGSICRAVGAFEKQGNSVICAEENKFSFVPAQKLLENSVAGHLWSIFFPW